MLINLIAADCIGEMAVALDRSLIVEHFVVGELRRNPRDGSDPSELLHKLTANRQLRIASLDDDQFDDFLRLVGAPSPDNLGDGEAATIACAGEHGSVAVDDGKALRVIAQNYPSLAAFCTLDLLCSAQAFLHFGEQRIREAVRDAVRLGRMRIPFTWRSWVEKLLNQNEM